MLDNISTCSASRTTNLDLEEKDRLRESIRRTRKEIEFIWSLEDGSIQEIAKTGISDAKVEKKEPKPVSDPTLEVKPRRMPSFGKEHEYLVEQNRLLEEQNQELQEQLMLRISMASKIGTPIELSQGRDVTQSQERQLMREMIGETSSDVDEHTSRRVSGEAGRRPSVLVPESPSGSCGDSRENPTDRISEATTDDDRRSPRSSLRRNSSEQKTVRIKVQPEVRRIVEDMEFECAGPSDGETELKGLTQCDKKSYRSDKKHTESKSKTKRKTSYRDRKDSDSDEYYESQGRRHSSSSTKRQGALDRRRKKHEDSESESELSTPSKGHRKRQHSRQRGTDESDSERTPTKRGFLKLDKYDGTSPLEVFLYQFDNCCEYNKWNSGEKLAQLKAALKGNAAQVLLGGEEVSFSYRTLRDELQKCFGVEGHTAQFRTMLRVRRRQHGESLRALYQDICKLLMLAYPGPSSELKDQLAVEAFVDSLEDEDLERRVKDRFPKDLAEAFKIALSLEANNSSRGVRREVETRRAPVRNYRRDLDARAMQDEGAIEDRLDEVEWRLRSAQLQSEKLEKQSEDAKIRNLENRMKGLESQSRKSKGGWKQQRQSWRSQSEPINNTVTMDMTPAFNSSTYARATLPVYTVSSEPQTFNDPHYVYPQRNVQPINRSTIEVSQPTQVTRARPVCHICNSGNHLIRNCPQAVCWNCNQHGHTRACCTADVTGPQVRGSLPSTTRTTAKTDNEINQRFTANIASTKGASMNDNVKRGDSHVYLVMECMGEARRFLLDSGCDTTIFPASYVRGAYVSPTSKRVFAANATEVDLGGEVKVDLKIGNLCIPTKALISDNVVEGLIGYDWLAQNDVFWGFGIGRVLIGGTIFRLEKRTKGDIVCRRLVVQEDVLIPPWSEAVVPTKVIIDTPELVRRQSKGDDGKTFMVDPGELDSGLIIAAAVVPNRCHNIPARVVNNSCRHIKLHQDDMMGDLQVGEVVETELSTEDAPRTTDWMDELMRDVDPSVTAEEREGLRRILESYTDCFSVHEFDLGRTEVVTHRIDTGNHRPVKQLLRRHPPAHLEEIDRQVKEMLSQDVIEPSFSPWSSNVVIVKKKDGNLRFCIDYRKLNDVTVKDSYPLPRINDCLDALSGGKYFSAFDLRSGYFQVKMDERDKEKTSFVTRSGLYQFKVLPFGVTNGVATFQRLMDLTMAGLNYKICLVYLDDIILMSRDVGEHCERLVMILDRLRASGLKLKPSKCRLLQKRISFLGHVVTGDGIQTDPEKVRAVVQWPTPVSVTEVRSFIGLCSYYRRFVRDFAFIAGPLHALTAKNARFKWTVECQQAFEELKRRLVSAPILAMPQDEGEYRLDTDASNEAIGAVLSQVQEGQERVVAYGSRLLRPQEKNYCVTRKELLAIVNFIKHFRPYLLGRKFTVRTDHAALKWLRNMAEPVGQQARWLESLEEYEFEVEHRPGKRHANADALSRRPCRQCSVEDEQPTVYLCGRVQEGKVDKVAVIKDSRELEVDKLRDGYSKDYRLSSFYTLFTTNAEVVPWSEVVGLDKFTKNLWTQWDRISNVNGVLYRKWVSADGFQVRWQLVAPKCAHETLLTHAHTGMTGGHMGIRKTMHQLQMRAYWPGWSEDVARFCRRCPECATYHRGQPKRQGELQIFPVGEPFERIAIDLTGPHTPSRSGHVYILTMVDLFTKWSEAIPIRNKEAVTVARALFDVILSRFGIPLQILSDNGKEFDNSLMKELCRLLEVDKVRTTVYKASTNGAVERLHRTMNAMLGKVVEYNQRNWDEFLPSVMAAYRASRHEATGYSPNYLMFGRENAAPLDVIFDRPAEEKEYSESYDEFAERKVEIMRQAYQLVRDHLGVSAERAKHYYDLRVRPNRFRPGQWVYYYCPRRFPRRSPKWQRMYTGPFLVVQVMGPVNVKLQSTQRSQPFVSHIDKLKLCLGPHPDGWLNDEDLVSVPEPAVVLESPVEQFQRRLEGDKTGDIPDQLDPFAIECESPEFPIGVAREGSVSECNDHGPLTLFYTEVRNGRDSWCLESPANAEEGVTLGGENEGRRSSRTRRLPRHLQDYVMRVAEYFRSAE